MQSYKDHLTEDLSLEIISEYAGFLTITSERYFLSVIFNTISQ